MRSEKRDGEAKRGDTIGRGAVYVSLVSVLKLMSFCMGLYLRLSVLELVRVYLLCKTGFPSYVASRDSSVFLVKTGRRNDVIDVDG